MNKFKFIQFLIVALLFSILACSDDSSGNATTNPNEESDLKEVPTIYDLGRCSAERENKVVFVIEENADYICRNSKWINITNYENQTSSSSVESSSSAISISSSSVESSSSINSSSSIIEYADIKPSGYYKDNCPSGKICTYVDTTYLNQQFLSENKYGEFLDERDYQVYKTIQIKSQVWMAQNLNYRSVFVRSGKAVADSGSSCYESPISPPDCEKFGRYYTWAAAMDSINQGGCGYKKECSPQQPHRGVCPEGWHIPSLSDWKDLEKVKYRYMGEQMKTTTGWYHNGNGDNSSGFSALPAGWATIDKNNYDTYVRYHEDQYQYAYFWSSSEASKGQAFHVKLKYTEDDINVIDDPNFGMFKHDEISVRCIKNNE